MRSDAFVKKPVSRRHAWAVGVAVTLTFICGGVGALVGYAKLHTVAGAYVGTLIALTLPAVVSIVLIIGSGIAAIRSGRIAGEASDEHGDETKRR